jgi:hypothetical protein
MRSSLGYSQDLSMMCQRPSWQSRAVMRKLQDIQLVLLSLGMAEALTDMVGKCVDASGERERDNGGCWSKHRTLIDGRCKAGRCRMMVALRCNTRGILIGKRA